MSQPVAIPQAYSLGVAEGVQELVSMTVPDSAETQAAMSETDLVREAQAGSADAFERLYRNRAAVTLRFHPLDSPQFASDCQ